MAKSPGRTAAQWRELIERYTRSGLTRRAFCAQQGIGESTLGAWQRRLRKEAPITSEATQGTALFTEVDVQGEPDGRGPEAPPAPGWDVELDLGDGICLRVRRRSC